MKDLITADTGPLIALARVNLLPLLSRLFNRVIVPSSVFKEACAELNKSGAKAILAASENTWFQCVPVDSEAEQSNHSLTKALSVLDRGERDVIILAKQLNTIALIDEKRGRKVANITGVHCIGTAAILIKLKEKQLIDSVSPYLDQLADTGYRLSAELIRKVRVLAGESGNKSRHS